MRICFVSRRFFPAISGMSVYAANLLRELVRMGHDVTMISQYRGDEEGTRVYGGGPPPPVPGVRVIGMEALGEQSGGDFERDVEALAATVAAEHGRAPFDVLHAQYGYPTGLAALQASSRTGVPNVVSIQGGDGHWVGSCCETHRRAMGVVLGRAGAVLIGSRSFAEEAAANNGVSPDLFTIIPGAVDTERFRPNPGAEPGDVSGEPVLLYHGRVDRRKGVLDLLEAFARLERPARLVLSGIGPDSEAAAALVGDLGLGGRVEISGYADYATVPDVYRRGEVFVSPTHAEGFSNTILEAMATGMPVVSTRAVGVVDCLRHEENALLHEPGDVDGMVEALRRVLDDGALRRRISRQALQEARARYAWPVAADRISGVYESLAGSEPDTAWSTDGPVEPCRFRETPHLL